ncbi:hypothetical protein [Paractinoplanes globisporus]|uniref:Uncharacterized protein n=1 Tax=Paractinoplanes globisporus TaxID=113565 RepID=A0ABW6WAI0_9ACTN|nr:hypothetical protein [Actinoplanes globisporus]
MLALSIGIAGVSSAPAYAATDRSGAERLNIPNSSVCRAGRVVDTSLLAAEMAAATREDDLETGVFGN